jgi:hypothetical protein
MALLKYLYDSIDDVPEEFRPLYAEREGKYELAEIEGVKTQADIDRLNKALAAEREEHKKTKGRVKGFGNYTPEQVEEMSSKLEELTAALEAGGKPDQAAIDKLVEARLPAHLKPLQRELAEAQERAKALDAENMGLKGDKIRRGLRDLVSLTLGGKKMQAVDRRAEPDIELWAERILTLDDDGRFVTKDGIGLTPGISLEEALIEVQASGVRPLWFKGNTSADAREGGDNKRVTTNGDNPFDKATWNLTKASQIAEKNPGEAKRLARAAKDKSRAKSTFPELYA